MRSIFATLVIWTLASTSHGDVVAYNYDSRLFHIDGAGDFRSGQFPLPYRYEYAISQISVGNLGGSISADLSDAAFSLQSFRVQLTDRETLENALAYRSTSLNPDILYNLELPEVSGVIRPLDGSGVITGELADGVGHALVSLTLDRGNIQGSIPHIIEYNLDVLHVTLIGTLGVSSSEIEFNFPLQQGPTLSFGAQMPSVEASNWQAYGRFTNPATVPEGNVLYLLFVAGAAIAARRAIRAFANNRTTGKGIR